MRFRIVVRPVSLVRLVPSRNLTTGSILSTGSKKAPLAKGPLPRPDSLYGKGQSVSKKELEFETKNRYGIKNGKPFNAHANKLKTEQKGKLLKYGALAAGLLLISFVALPSFTERGVNHAAFNGQVLAAKAEYNSGLSSAELAAQQQKEHQERTNKVGLLAWQKRQEKLRGINITPLSKEEEELGRKLDLVPEDPRTLAEIKAEIAQKSAKTDTWKLLQSEIEDGKTRA